MRPPIRPHQLRFEGVDTDGRREEVKLLDVRNAGVERHGEEMGVEDGARAVSRRVEPHVTGVTIAELLQFRGGPGRAALGRAGQFGVALHPRPDLLRADHAQRPFDERVADGVGEDVPCVPAAAAQAAQQLPQRLHEAGLPDEVDRIDPVRLPELEVLGGDRQAVLLGDQPAVRPDHDPEGFIRGARRHAERGRIGERFLHVLAEDPLDIFRQRRDRCHLRSACPRSG